MNAEQFQLYSHLVSEIESEVRRRWDEHGAPSVLSKVGLVLSEDAKTELTNSGVKLKAFVLMHMEDQIRHFYDRRTTDCVSPLPESAGFSQSQLLERFFGVKEQSSPPTVDFRKFDERVWSAFTTYKKSRRFISFDADGQVNVIDQDTKPEDGEWIEILDSDLSFDPAGNRLTIAELRGKISAWCEREGVNISRLQVFEPRPAKISKTEHHSDRSLLQAVTSVLTDEQLRRLNLPGDIIVSLNRILSK